MQYHAIGFDDSVGKVPGQSEFPDCPERCVRTFNKESTLIGHCDHKKMQSIYARARARATHRNYFERGLLLINCLSANQQTAAYYNCVSQILK